MGTYSDSVFEASFTSLLGVFGEPAVYTPYGGAPVNVQVVYSETLEGQVDGMSGTIQIQEPNITGSITDHDGEPAKGSTFYLSDRAVTKTVTEPIENNGLTFTVAVR
jgi:hypothetical protein